MSKIYVESVTSPKPLTLSIVGRPNVGKSTLFNRLIGRRKALVHNEPGVTRDRNEETTEWWHNREAIEVRIVDTGGLGGDEFDPEIFEGIQEQVKLAVDKSDAILFTLDAQSGLLPIDEEIYRLLKSQLRRKKEKPRLIGVVNKVDVEKHESGIADFMGLDTDSTLTLSAEHGRGIDDLKDTIFQLCEGQFQPKVELEKKDYRTPTIAIVGRPNVGKSTLLNALLGEDRMITSAIAGTTVDSISSMIHLDGKLFEIVDTPGIRRKNKTKQGVEVLSFIQTRKALEQADLALLILDGELGISEQDEKIAGLIEDVGCSMVILMNKWDTQTENPKFTQEMAEERVRKQMAFLKFAPIGFISAKNSEGFKGLGRLLENVFEQRNQKVPTRELSEFIRVEATVHNPANAKFYLTQHVSKNPPTFVSHVNDPDKINFSLKRHLVNSIRKRWGFVGSPIRLNFTRRGEKKSTR